MADAPNDRNQCNSRFEQLLQRCKVGRVLGPQSASESVEALDPLDADIANQTRWFRAEPPPATIVNARAPNARWPIGSHQRVLVGGTPSRPQARIHIDKGRFAGSQIHLTIVAGQIQAEVLTANETSRQTLVVAMEVVRKKLRTQRPHITMTSSSDVGPLPDDNADNGSGAATRSRPIRVRQPAETPE